MAAVVPPVARPGRLPVLAAPVPRRSPSSSCCGSCPRSWSAGVLARPTPPASRCSPRGSDGSGHPALALLGLGGIWDGLSVPDTRQTWLAVAAIVFVARQRRDRRTPLVGVRARPRATGDRARPGRPRSWRWLLTTKTSARDPAPARRHVRTGGRAAPGRAEAARTVRRARGVGPRRRGAVGVARARPAAGTAPRWWRPSGILFVLVPVLSGARTGPGRSGRTRAARHATHRCAGPGRGDHRRRRHPAPRAGDAAVALLPELRVGGAGPPPPTRSSGCSTGRSSPPRT